MKTITYAINADLTVDSLSVFSEPDGDELAYGITEDELMEKHPHAIALRSALEKHGPTKFDYMVGLAGNGRAWFICLTCKNPDAKQMHSEEHASIIALSGLESGDGSLDESGDHAMVRSNEVIDPAKVKRFQNLLAGAIAAPLDTGSFRIRADSDAMEAPKVSTHRDRG